MDTVRWQGADHRVLRAAHGGDQGFNQEAGDQVIIKYGDGSERVVLAAGDDSPIGGRPPTGIEAPPSSNAPSNVDRPYIGQTGNIMTSTMGNWDGEPTSYGYQWQKDGVSVAGADASAYTVTSDDVGKTMTCVVTATNAAGSTESTSVGLIAV